MTSNLARWIICSTSNNCCAQDIYTVRASLGATITSHDATTRARSSPDFQPTHTTPSAPSRMSIASPLPTHTPTTRGGNFCSSSTPEETAASYFSCASRWTVCTA